MNRSVREDGRSVQREEKIQLAENSAVGSFYINF